MKRIRSLSFRRVVLASLLLFICSMSIGASACGKPKPATSVPPQTQAPQTKKAKALSTLETVRTSTRKFTDTYMQFYRDRLAQINADKSLTDEQRFEALKVENDRANAINEAFGKAVTFERETLNIIVAVSTTDFQGSTTATVLNQFQKVVGVFNDPLFAQIGNQKFHDVVTGIQTALQTIIGILQLQSGENTNVEQPFTEPINEFTRIGERYIWDHRRRQSEFVFGRN